jgi:2-polyprenyl-3-methyl-5-hydroxy-6-metoxy-1,4-benzoquinol methylase
MESIVENLNLKIVKRAIILQHFKELHRLNNNYKLFFAGDFSGDHEQGTLEWYMRYIVEKLGLQDNVFFDGFIDNHKLPDWLEDKHYIVTGSIAEGHPVGIMEAMSCGLKPVIHAYPGVENHYPNKYIYRDVQEFIKIITDDEYDSFEYSQFISENYSLEKQLNLIKDILNQMEVKKHSQKQKITQKSSINKNNASFEEIQEFYDNFLDYLKNDRERPNKRHEYIKHRLKQIIKSGDKVLDLGCGIGITTEFISTLNVSKVIGVDLSPKLIEFAKNTVRNAEFLVHDITTLNLNEKFDVISLCDVIEHIPRERYPELFNTIKRHLKDNGHVFITIPDPDYNDFIRKHRPEKMQIIDNSVTFNEILHYCSVNGLKVKLFNMYGIWLPNEYNEYILVNENLGKDSWKKFYMS